MSVPVILASASPRRHELLDLIGIRHSVIPADIDESLRAGEVAHLFVERLAREKALAVVAAADLSGARDGGAESRLVIAADTVVLLDGQIMGKPGSVEDAVRMLSRLSGRTHTVVTGMACYFNGRSASGVEEVAVTFRELSREEIHQYVATGEPMDKAGAYGIQGYGATIVQRIDGDYFAVMGLSLVRLVNLMRQLGVHYHFGQVPLST